MPTDPLTAARYPISTSVPNVPQDIQNAVNDLSDLIGGKFTTISARDAAFTTWVAQGNTMSDGLTCRVGGYEQVYRGGSWHGVGTGGLFTATAPSDTTTVFTTTQTALTVSVPDPLFPYRVLCSANVVLAQLGSNVTVAGRILVNGTVTNPVGPDITNANAGAVAVNQLIPVWGNAASGTLTGATTVSYQMFKTGTAGNGYQLATSAYNSLTVLVVPA